MKLEGPLKIIGLQAENVKKLVAVEIKPDGALVEITGRNGQGKTSILDSIWWAIEGAKHIQAAPIRKGAKKARIKLDLGEVIVTRTFNRKAEDEAEFTTTVTVENADGARFPSPQKMLDDLFGVLTFDPMAFLREAPAKQLLMLRALVPGVDFEAVDKANKDDVAKRTEANRNAKALRSQAAGINVSPGTPDEPVDVAPLEAELANAAGRNTDIERERSRRGAMRIDIDRKRKHASELFDEAVRMKQIATETAAEADALEHDLSLLGDLETPTDTAEVMRKLSEARETNIQVKSKKHHAEIEQRAAGYEDQSEELTKAIDDRKQQVEDAIKAAALPVDGLTLADDAVMLNGLPLEQASDAEQLRTAVAIAMAMNPTLRVLRIRDGSLLDDNGMRLLSDMAETQGYQVWIERVDTTGKVGFVIEDGSVKARPTAGTAE